MTQTLTPVELHHREVERALQAFWANRSGFGISESENLKIANAGKGTDVGFREPDGPETYGEILPVGVRTLGRAMGISGPGFLIGRDIEYKAPIFFMDLGCGLGKLVAQAYLEWPVVDRAVGVELSPTRAAHANAAWKGISASGVADQLRSASHAFGGGWGSSSEASGSAPDSHAMFAAEAVKFKEGDIFKTDLSEATHIYMASLRFPDIMMDRLAAKISTEATKLHAIATLRAFPTGLQGFEYIGSWGVEMEWTTFQDAGEKTHIYIRRST